MNGRDFLASLAHALPERWPPNAPQTWSQWSTHMVDQLHAVAAGANLSCVCQYKHPSTPGRPEQMREVLYDMCWFDDQAEYALPVVLIEHENSSAESAFLFDMWKLMFAQARLRVMIGYASSDTYRDVYGALIDRTAAASRWNYPAGSEDIVLVGTKTMPTPHAFAVFAREAGAATFQPLGMLV